MLSGCLPITFLTFNLNGPSAAICYYRTPSHWPPLSGQGLDMGTCRANQRLFSENLKSGSRERDLVCPLTTSVIFGLESMGSRFCCANWGAAKAVLQRMRRPWRKNSGTS